VLAISIERDQGLPLYRQIRDQIREAIREQRLQPRDKLPSVRELSAQLDVARITVATAYDELTAEGYLSARVGSGTHVVERLPVETATPSTEAARKLPASNDGTAWAPIE
jgi:GntR family transcriptional regulator/MocR family aminotransferase